jgi:hypothetical protein
MSEIDLDGPLELLRVPGLGWTLALPVLPDGPRGEGELRVWADRAVLAFGTHQAFRLDGLDPAGMSVLRGLSAVELVEIDEGDLVARHRVVVRPL